jgi:5-methylcytosine-specific restriction enzyme subunit McrC
MMRIELQENTRGLDVELTPDQAGLLAASGVVEVTRRPGRRPGVWRVRAKRLVGSARFGSGPAAIEVRIAPKIDIARLLFLVGYAPSHWDWREDEVTAAAYPDLLPAVAYAFVRAADRALRQGVLLGYRQVDEAVTTVRGRIREGDQSRRRYGLPLPLEVRHDRYTIDIAENRLLLAAAVRLLRLPGVPGEVRRSLQRLRLRLDGVAAPPPGPVASTWRPNRLNVRYHTALGLAELVLGGGSYELEDGSAVRVDGLLLDMARVFETFVTLALIRALRPYGGRCREQDRHHLDRRGRITLKPDLVYYRADGAGRERPATVVDIKYKIESDTRGRNPALYQILTYCAVLGVPCGHLVYAKGEAEPTTHVVNGPHDFQIVQHALDLEQPPARLLGQIAELAGRLAGQDALVRG